VTHSAAIVSTGGLSALAQRSWMPVAALLFASSLWGLTWLPFKAFAAQGLSGPLVAMLSYGIAGIAGLPLLLRQRGQWRPDARWVLWIGLVGGWGNTAFVSAMVLGDVVRVMLLFYLAPVWAVLGGRIFLQERISARRGGAVALSLLGAFLVVGGMKAFDSAPSASDILAVSAGLGFAGNNILARKVQGVPSGSKTVSLLLGCAFTSWLMLLVMQRPGNADAALWAAFTPALIGLLLAFSLIWMALVSFAWQWSVTRLEAGRSGVIAIAELVVAIVSATLLGSETMTALDCMGAGLIAAATVLEATDSNPPQPKDLP
jgi:drug/metabolite transporter (DMT)-like permease